MRLMLLVVLLATACSSVPQAPKLVIACEPAQGASCDLSGFLHACQRAGERNFTWTGETDAKLRATQLDCPRSVEVAADELDSYIARTLASHGFELRPVGPEHLHVFEVRPRG